MFQVFERKIYRGLRKSAPRSKGKKEGMSEGFSRAHCMAEGWGGSIDFTDVLLLLKIDGQWKCVAKAYNQNSNTISK